LAFFSLSPLINARLRTAVYLGVAKGSPAAAFLPSGERVRAKLVYSRDAENSRWRIFTEMENTKMRSMLLALAAFLALAVSVAAQSSADKPPAQQRQAPPQAAPDLFAKVPPPRPEDVNSLDHILVALYGVISGPAGERDWNRFRSLFLPQGRLTAATKNADGSFRIHPMGVEDYAKGAGSYFLQHAFFESPIVNRIETFGNVTQVFSSYESRHAAGEAPFARGINSIQLLNDGTRWWIVSILWDEERSDNPLPKEFAAKSPAEQK
jgi:hypothetical protein